MIFVKNKKDGFDGFEIGRNTPLGNPYSHKSGTRAEFLVETRAEAIEKYEGWLREQIRNKVPGVCNYLNTIYRAAKRGNINLVCSCKPLACHGDVIKRILEEKMLDLGEH